MEHLSMITGEFACQLFNPTTPCKFSPNLPHTPSRSSPLSLRPQKITTGLFSPKMLPSPPSSPPDFLIPKRLFKPVPVISREKGREARRNLFLTKVRTGREDKIIKSRGGEDEMMRLIFVSEQKRWEATQARAAATISTIYEEEELEVGDPQGYEVPDQPEQAFGVNQDDDFDEIIEREGEELEALLSQLDLDLPCHGGNPILDRDLCNLNTHYVNETNIPSVNCTS